MFGNSNFIEITPGGGYRAIESSNPNYESIQSRLGILQATAARMDAGSVRYDTHQASMTHLGMHMDDVQQGLQRYAQHNDDFAANMGMFQPRDLTVRMRRVMEERMPPLNSFTAFPINTEVVPGALRYEQSRSYTTGEAIVYRGGSGADVPSIGLGAGWFTAPVLYFVSRVDMNWLEALRVNMTGLDTNLRKMRGARRVLGEIVNRLAWQGSAAWGMYGALNHPYVDKLFSSVNFGSGSADDISEALHSYATYAEDESGSTFQPNTLLISTYVFNKIANKRFSSSNGDTVLDQFKRANPHIKRIIKVRELNNAGPGGEHAMIFFRAGAGAADSSMEMVQVLPPTVLPPEHRALQTSTFLVTGFGGLNQTEVGDNLVVYVEI